MGFVDVIHQELVQVEAELAPIEERVAWLIAKRDFLKKTLSEAEHLFPIASGPVVKEVQPAPEVITTGDMSELAKESLLAQYREGVSPLPLPTRKWEYHRVPRKRSSPLSRKQILDMMARVMAPFGDEGLTVTEVAELLYSEYRRLFGSEDSAYNTAQYAIYQVRDPFVKVSPGRYKLRQDFITVREVVTAKKA